MSFVFLMFCVSLFVCVSFRCPSCPAWLVYPFHDVSCLFLSSYVSLSLVPLPLPPVQNLLHVGVFNRDLSPLGGKAAIGILSQDCFFGLFPLSGLLVHHNLRLLIYSTGNGQYVNIIFVLGCRLSTALYPHSDDLSADAFKFLALQKKRR